MLLDLVSLKSRNEIREKKANINPPFSAFTTARVHTFHIKSTTVGSVYVRIEKIKSQNFVLVYEVGKAGRHHGGQAHYLYRK